MSGELKSWSHSFGQNCYHLIWSPKYRIHMLKHKQLKAVCRGILKMIAFEEGWQIHEIEILSDHIHLFIEIPPTVSISSVFQILKGKSSRILRRNFTWLRKFRCLWSRGKFYRSVGNVTKGVIEHYIQHSQGSWNYFDTRRLYTVPEQTTLHI